MERRTFFGVVSNVFGTLLFGPEVVGQERPQVLYGGIDYDYHAQYGLVEGVSVMLPEAYEEAQWEKKSVRPIIAVEYDDGTFGRMRDDGTFS